MASYPCLSLLRTYKVEQEYGDIYIYLESGYKYLQKLMPGSVMGMDTVFLIESAEGRTMYCSDENLVPLFSDLQSCKKELSENSRRYKTYERTEEGGWKIHLWVPVKEYYRQIYGMGAEFERCHSSGGFCLYSGLGPAVGGVFILLLQSLKRGFS